jgi:hypothetical protein
VGPIVDFIISSDPTITVTSDKDFWMDSKYSVVIVREHELKDLEGVEIKGLTGVFLLTIAPEAAVHRSFQSIGRVGRLGQAATRAFVFMDKTNWKQWKREAVSQEHLRKFILENHEAKEIVLKDANSSLADIRCPRRLRPVDPSAAVVDEAKRLNGVANKIHVCPFAVFDGVGKPYLCPVRKRLSNAPPAARRAHMVSRQSILNGLHYKTTGRTPNYYRTAECRCGTDDEVTVCDGKLCVLHPRRPNTATGRSAAGNQCSKISSSAIPQE